MSFMDDFDHLKIQLKDIKLATHEFGDKPIGTGGFGRVYKGELSLPEGNKMVAFKRLDRKHGQGDIEFWKEIMMLSQYKHENLISLLHFCNMEGERILVYEYATRGSLDHCLGDTSLTWIQRLKICHGAASGLNYLHDPMDMHQRVLHRDVKSANILLDENLTAKISDFGLSKFGPANQKYTYMVSNLVGTPGYCDPVYMETGSLSKESDVYSFGVVLFEVMCGRLCFDYYNKEYKILLPVWKQSYEENRLDDLVCKDLKEQIDGDSLLTFSRIAYRCLHRDRKQRPTFGEIINELEISLDHQEMSEDVDERSTFEERIIIANQATAPVPWKTRNELALVLSKGILVMNGDHWVSENKNGEYCEMICGGKCIPLANIQDYGMRDVGHIQPFSRDKRFPCISLDSNFQLQASPRFLSPHVTYSINLVYRKENDTRSHKGKYVPLKYKLHTETEYQTSCVARRRGDWLVTELYQFTSHDDQKEHPHYFIFDFSSQQLSRTGGPGFNYKPPFLDDTTRFKVHLIGIEFLPVEPAKDKKAEDEVSNEVDMQSFLDEDDRILAGIMKASKCNPHRMSNKELYDLLRNGFFVHKYGKMVTNGEMWFSVSESMKKCYMLPAEEVLKEPNLKSLLGRKKWKSVWGSRFLSFFESLKTESFTLRHEIYSWMLSDDTNYGCYLVYQLPTDEHNSNFSGLVQITCEFATYKQQYFLDLLAPTHIPYIIDKREGHPERKMIKTRQIIGHPTKRNDGWMEIQILAGIYSDFIDQIHCHVKSCTKWNFEGLRVQGIEFRPATISFVG